MPNSAPQHNRRRHWVLRAGTLLFVAGAAVGLGTGGAMAAAGESACTTGAAGPVGQLDESLDMGAVVTSCPPLDGQVDPAPAEPTIAQPTIAQPTIAQPTIAQPTSTQPARYDLALIIRVARNQVFFVGNTVTFELVVANHGDLPSGPFSVQQVIPPGMAPVGASHGGAPVAGTVQWTDLAELVPGEQRTLTSDLRLETLDAVNGHRSIAEISRDSGDDWDSTPDNNPYNDGLIETDDVSLAIVGDSDDHDVAEITAAQVRFDNQLLVAPTQTLGGDPAASTAPVPGSTPATPRGDTVPTQAMVQPAAAEQPLPLDTSPPRGSAPIGTSGGAAKASNIAGQPSTSTVSAEQARLLPATGSATSATLLMAVALTSAGLLLIGVRRSQILSRSREDG